MPIKPPHYRILLADPGNPDDVALADEHDVYVLHGDQLRAELEAPRSGIPAMDKAPMHNITLWLWAALMRTHVIDQPFQEFKPRLLAFEDLEDADTPAADGSPGDPTQPAAGTGSP